MKRNDACQLPWWSFWERAIRNHCWGAPHVSRNGVLLHNFFMHHGTSILPFIDVLEVIIAFSLFFPFWYCFSLPCVLFWSLEVGVVSPRNNSKNEIQWFCWPQQLNILFLLVNCIDVMD